MSEIKKEENILTPAQEQYRRLRRMKFSDRKFKYLTEPTCVDIFLAKNILRLIPLYVSPNSFTIFRFISIPFVVGLILFEHNVAAIIFFVASALTDAVDGALARTRYQITSWGIVADPIADKLLIGSVAAIVIAKYLWWQLAATIVGIEIVLVSFAFFRYRGQIVPAKTMGKIKMILQCVGVGLVLLYSMFSFAPILTAAMYILFASVLFALLSLFVYRSI
jgi:phosphatidylglycerophosphate synthase